MLKSALFGIVPVLALALPACQRGDAAVPAIEKSAKPAESPEAVKTQPANPDPCAWISAEEAGKLLGPLDGAPWRADHSDSAEPRNSGHACGYTLADHKGKIVVEVLTESANSFEQGVAMVAGKLSQDAGKSIAGEVAGSIAGDTTASGWDYTGALPSEFRGRIGNIAVQVGIHGDNLRADSVPRLATLVRDRIPDLPIATDPYDQNSEDGPDPCGLVTREEAEAVLGKLLFPPYRSNSDKVSFADPHGRDCSYYLGRHHVITLQIHWEQGKTLFKMSSGFGANLAAALGAQGPTADTLDGSWDQAGAGPTGDLYFLKGDQMLGISYDMAGVDLAAAVKLARIAVGRLK